MSAPDLARRTTCAEFESLMRGSNVAERLKASEFAAGLRPEEAPGFLPTLNGHNGGARPASRAA